MQPDHDVIVIGGSANGSRAAFAASGAGANVAIVEEHPVTGLPEHCSGLFSYWGLNELDCFPPDDIILNREIYGSRIISPSGKIITVRKKSPHAIVCDRAAFDNFLLNRAINRGVTVYQPYKAINSVRKDGIVLVDLISQSGEKKRITAPMVISAEGIRAEISKQLGLSSPKPFKIINAAQFYMDNLNDIDSSLVEIYQSQKYAPNFFGWIIPMSDNSAKVGLGTSRKAAAKELIKMINEHPILKEKCSGADIKRKTAGRIPIGGYVDRTYADNLLLTGDVAGQTKPTTGGGVILGGIAAHIAGEVAAESSLSGNIKANFLKKYEKYWKKEMKRNLQMMKLVRNYMNLLTDDEVDHLFGSLNNKEILANIESYGHVDNQAKLVFKFMRFWRLYPFYLKTSGRLVKSFFA